jgi:hypothetical protein
VRAVIIERQTAQALSRCRGRRHNECAAFTLAMVAILIKLDPKGPVLFRQKRHGFNNEPPRLPPSKASYAAPDQVDRSYSRRRVRPGARRERQASGRWTRRRDWGLLSNGAAMICGATIGIGGSRSYGSLDWGQKLNPSRACWGLAERGNVG